MRIWVTYRKTTRFSQLKDFKNFFYSVFSKYLLVKYHYLTLPPRPGDQTRCKTNLSWSGDLQDAPRHTIPKKAVEV